MSAPRGKVGAVWDTIAEQGEFRVRVEARGRTDAGVDVWQWRLRIDDYKSDLLEHFGHRQWEGQVTSRLGARRASYNAARKAVPEMRDELRRRTVDQSIQTIRASADRGAPPEASDEAAP